MLRLFDHELPIHTMTRYTTARDRADASLDGGQVYSGQYARIIEASLVDTDPDQSLDEGLLLGARAIKRLRVTYDKADDRPYSTSLSWFPTHIPGVDKPLDEVCPALLECERIRQGTPAYLREQTGLTIDKGLDRVAVARASQTEAELLDIDLGAPVKRTVSMMYSGEHLVEYAESTTASQSWTRYQWERHQ